MAEEQIDVGESKQVERLKKAAKQDHLQRKETVRKAMGDEQIRKWFYEILLACRIGQNPYSSDPLLMAHSCGEMNIGLRIRSDIETAAPELYLQMMKENNDG